MNKQKIKYYSVASRGRDPIDPKNRKAGSYWVQKLEVNITGFSNSITSVSKDAWVLEIHDD